MARRRRKSSGVRAFTITVLIGLTGTVVWWTSFRAHDPTAEPGLGLDAGSALTSDRPEVDSAAPPRTNVTEKGADDATSSPIKPAASQVQRVAGLIDAGEQAVARDDLVAARTHFSEAFALGLSEPERTRVRAELTRLASATILSGRLIEGDPLASRYIVQAGDTLAKIAQANQVSDDLLAAINGIANKNLIRLGQTLKIVKGPFHAVVDRKLFVMDVYLGTIFVKQFPVGLGIDGSTPSGEWRVKSKLKNPTYYPPRGGSVIDADDPKNPLGERWIGLVGVGGEALGQERYGIHGTIEPESIGQSSSLGCIRLHNEDVEALFMYLVAKHSIVTIK